MHELPRSRALPILLNLHGAGLEADSQRVRHMLDTVPDLRAWVLFPSGVTPWSADDWHAWGFADIKAATRAIPEWIKTFAWEGPAVDIDRWLVSGHSNGGQGTWYALTHWPDNVIAGVPVSGYSSIQAYVSFHLWHEADPRVTSILQTALANYRHELLLENFAGIPVLQQHGNADDNVPVFHSRRLSQLIWQTGSLTEYIEMPGKGHWFDGIMATRSLREFYLKVLGTNEIDPELPQRFTMVVANPGDMGSRGGIIVDQLESPDQLGRITVERCTTSTTWKLTTSNIHRWHLSSKKFRTDKPELIIDTYIVALPSNNDRSREFWLVRLGDGSWTISRDDSWRAIQQRYGRQLGALDAILRTSGRFAVVFSCDETLGMALQISRNLFQYFAADTEIINSHTLPLSFPGNVISLSLGPNLSSSRHENYPITVEPDQGMVVRDASDALRTYQFEEGLGAAFLRPLSHESLELVIWGYDDAGLRQAARLMPMLTGVGQPDFVVVSRRCKWKGASGVLAMGFLDYAWNVSKASFFS
ncbi:MAG: hypothetical protein FRX48_06431 [Lasallia pustulata]|uniref:Peptidase S9 prolyl oligopeptidase catalytic domain-containing protein n=1 Tax=Lasallia pustulata TaxID=136370 RepID=A0A5M8PK41_9LECA|nr:MAG: hypothetical protein FRX48_06431 [Lasallia pustulata]